MLFGADKNAEPFIVKVLAATAPVNKTVEFAAVVADVNLAAPVPIALAKVTKPPVFVTLRIPSLSLPAVINPV